MEIECEDRDKTGFISPLGCYRWIRMPFGLKNALYYLKKLMEIILGPFLYVFVVVYIDDIIIISKTKEEHLLHLEKVL